MLIYINSNEKTKMTNPVLSIENVIDNPHIKWNVAANPNTPVETLKVLATDKDYGVRQYIARNPNTPAETLKVLATDKDYSVRQYVANNPSTPVETQKFFVDEGKAPDGYVEVGLLLVFTNHHPYRDIGGFLDFRLEKEYQEIKVYIPLEATESKGALETYVYKRLEDEEIDTVSIIDVNIWDDEEDDIEFEWDYPDFDYNNYK